MQATYQEIYNEAIANGVTPMMADMLASRQGPGLKTDTTIWGGAGTLDSQFKNNQPHLKLITEAAKKAGYTPNPNYVYQPALAEFLGDPKAFVPPSEGNSHVRKVCEERGWGCEGAVKIKTPQGPPPKPVKLAESLIREGVTKMVTDNPDLARKPIRQLREAVIDKHAPQDS